MAVSFSTSQMTKIAVSHFRGHDSLCPRCRDGVVKVKPKLMPGPHVLLRATCPICHAAGQITSNEYGAKDLPRWTPEQSHRVLALAVEWHDQKCPVDGAPLHVDRSQKGRNIVIAVICPRCLNEALYEDRSR